MSISRSTTWALVTQAMLIVAGLAALVSVSRWSRVDQSIDPEAAVRDAIRPEAAALRGGDRPAPEAPAAPEAEKAIADLQNKLEKVQRDVNRLNRQLEAKDRELAALAAPPAPEARPAAVPAADPEEQKRLQNEIDELKKRVAESNKKSDEAKQQLDKMQADARVGDAEKAPVVERQGVNKPRRRDEIVAQKIGFDPRRFRDPMMPRFEANPAAVAAASSAGAARGGGGNWHGATAIADIVRGEAEFVRAVGERNLNDSQALINTKTAAAMELENRMQATETFFEMRRVNRANREFEAGPPPTLEDIVRYARMAVPPRLTSMQLDPDTGEISWPRVLTDKPYTSKRDFVQEQFHLRARERGSIDFAQLETLTAAMDAFKEQLKENVNKYKAGAYGEARTFLDSLLREFEMPLR
jgi:hypothetical protein